MTQQEKFEALVREQGFNNVQEFSRAVGMDRAGITHILREDVRPQLRKLFVWANTLGVKVEALLNIFYEEEMKQNCKVVMQSLPRNTITREEIETGEE